MPRRCAVTGKKVMYGNNVSHANNKTRRRFVPNMHKMTLLSDALGEKVSMDMTSHGLRSIEHAGGLDAYLLGASKRNLTPESLSVRKRVEKALARQTEAAPTA